MDDELATIRARKLARLQEALQSAQAAVVSPIALTDATFREFIGNARVVLVDFWAPWCTPCRAVAPVVEALARTYAGQLAVGKLNVDESPRTTAQFGVESIPTLLVFREGKLVDSIVGAVPRPVLEGAVQRWL